MGQPEWLIHTSVGRLPGRGALKMAALSLYFPLVRRSPEFVQPCRGCVDQPSVRHADIGEPGNLSSDILELAAKDSSDDGCRRIRISPQRDGALHGGRWAFGYS